MVIQTNNSAVRSTSIAGEVQEKTLLNLVRDADGDSLVVGAGFRHPFPEMVEALRLEEKRRKEEENKRHKQTMDFIQAQLAALQDQLAGLEKGLGGLNKMGQHLGVSRKLGETDDDYRKRIREEVNVQIMAGTLNDPTGEYRAWGSKYDQIQAKKAEIDQGVNYIEQADNKQEAANASSFDVLWHGDTSAVLEVDAAAREVMFERREQGAEVYSESAEDSNDALDGFLDDDLFASANELQLNESFNLASSGVELEQESTLTLQGASLQPRTLNPTA